MPLLDERGLPGYLFLYLTMFVICFVEADAMMKLSEKFSKIVIWILVCTVIASLIAIHEVPVNNGVSKVICIIAALAIFELSIYWLKDARRRDIISFISGISFEIYLMHHVFAFGRFSVMNITPNWWIGFMLLTSASIGLGCGLSRIRLLL